MKERNQSRQCGACTLCCDGWLETNVNGIDVGPENPCKHLTCSGCGIYEDRPIDPCRSFMCAWVANSNLFPDWMRPDLSKVIFMPENFSWMGNYVDGAFHCGNVVPDSTIKWLTIFSKEKRNGFLIITGQVFENDKKKSTLTILGPDAFRADIEKLVKNREFSIHDKVIK